jgi:hypothetical protein
LSFKIKSSQTRETTSNINNDEAPEITTTTMATPSVSDLTEQTTAMEINDEDIEE